MNEAKVLRNMPCTRLYQKFYCLVHIKRVFWVDIYIMHEKLFGKVLKFNPNFGKNKNPKSSV